MGLDMYLRAGQYASAFTNQELYGNIITALHAGQLASTDGGATVQLTVGYWRKANAIHNWFVGDREDNCQPIYVERSNLQELLSTCEQLLINRDENQAEELLPPVGGFFFGSTEINEWYWEGILKTKEILENVLANTDDSWYFEYQASW